MTPTPEYRTIELSRGQSAIVDAGDYEHLSQWKWNVCWSETKGAFYAWRKEYSTGGSRNPRAVWMHRLIMGQANRNGFDVDHIDGNTLDNRRFNLRVATRSQNSANRGKPSNNTSGFKGVSLHKGAGKWVAKLRVNGRLLHLGLHVTPEEAHIAYQKAARFHFGEFAAW